MDKLISQQAAIDKIKKRLFETAFNNVGVKQNIDETLIDVAENRLENWFDELPSVQLKQNARIFQEIIVEYPSISTYPEYEGKPYFSIKYTEDGQDFIGYGTYKPDVLSEYLKKYFTPSAQPERKTGHWVEIGDEPYDEWECDVCGFVIDGSGCIDPEEYRDVYRFCPNCGADMRGDKHETD